MADRVALFNDGQIVQVGTPQEIYRQPNSRFVADFVGSSNILPPDFVTNLGGEPRWASLRPESIHLVQQGGHAASVVAISFLGGSTRLSVEIDSLRINLLLPSTAVIPTVGERVSIDWKAGDMHLMESGA